MRSLLDSEVNALRVWLREEIADAERLARDPRVREAVTELARTAARGASRDELCAGSARAKVEEVLRPQRVTDLLEALDELLQSHPWTQEQARLCWERIPPATRAAAGPQSVSAS